MFGTAIGYDWLLLFGLIVIGVSYWLRTRLERQYKKEVSALENFDASSMHIAFGIFSYFAIDLKRRSIALRGSDKLHRYEANEILEFTPNLKNLNLTNSQNEKDHYLLHVFTRDPENPEVEYIFDARKHAVKAVQALSNLMEAEIRFEQQHLKNQTNEFRSTVLSEMEQSNLKHSEARNETNEFRTSILTKIKDTEEIQDQTLEASLLINEAVRETNKKAELLEGFQTVITDSIKEALVKDKSTVISSEEQQKIETLSAVVIEAGITRETVIAGNQQRQLVKAIELVESRHLELWNERLNENGVHTRIVRALEPIFTREDHEASYFGYKKSGFSSTVSQIRNPKIHKKTIT